METFLTLDDIAAQLKAHRRTVKNWCKSGKLPFFRIGGLYRVRGSDFDKFTKATTAKKDLGSGE